MIRKLNERERRILAAGLVVAAVILACTFGPQALGQWQRVRADLATLQGKLKDIPDPKQQKALLAVVPVFQVPEAEEKQKFLFLDRLREQFKKGGINPGPLTFLSTKKKVGAYRMLCVKCNGKCRLDQLLDFLASLKENEYYMGVEEFRIQSDTKQPPEKRQDVEFDLTVSTLVPDAAARFAAKEPS